MRIAIFDYSVTRNNPAGSCHLRMIEHLCDEHVFTVFAPRFDNTRPDRVKWVRVPVLKRPLVLQFVLFHIVAPICYAWRRFVRKDVFDLIQFVESNLWFGDVSYAHFCHKEYLQSHWRQAGNSGLRSIFRYWDHTLHSILEPWCFRRVRKIIVPSRGLSDELSRRYESAKTKLSVLPNPVDLQRMERPDSFDRQSLRASLGLTESETVLVFVALGQFERKGLPQLLEAMSQIDSPLRLVIVGGESDLVAAWKWRADAKGLCDRVHFVGMQREVRPYLWAADAFVLPSLYEVFPLVALEAAAAGLPLLITRLNGVEEFLQDGRNGIVLDRTADGIRTGLQSFLELNVQQRNLIGKFAHASVQKYSIDNFVAQWREFYSSFQA
jgi:glycosyltransferase involved in cell wall biosynthesis